MRVAAAAKGHDGALPRDVVPLQYQGRWCQLAPGTGRVSYCKCGENGILISADRFGRCHTSVRVSPSGKKLWAKTDRNGNEIAIDVMLEDAGSALQISIEKASSW